MSKNVLPNREPFQKRTGMDEGNLRLVSASAIFSGILPGHLRDLLRDSAVQDFPRNSILFLQGDDARRFYIVLEGWIKIFLATPDGRETILRVCGVGDSFAEAAMFERDGYLTSACTCTEVRVLGVPTATFKTHIFTNRELRERILLTMSQKYRLLTYRIEELSSQSAAQRLARFLLSLCPPEDETAIVRLPLPKGVIAAALGMQPETFSRLLSKFRSDGVQVNGDIVSIANVRKLHHHSKGTSSESVSTPYDINSQEPIFARPGLNG